MSYRAMAWAAEQVTGSATRKAVLMYLADKADEEWSCFPGQERIAAVTEMAERTVRRALDDLVVGGFVRREQRRRPDGYRTSDRYWLRPDSVSGETPDGPTSPANDDRSHRPSTTTSPDTVTGREEPPVDPPVEPPDNPLSSTTPPAPTDAAPSAEVQQLCTTLADAVERYRDGAQGGRPKVTKAWLRDMRLLLERGPLEAEQAVPIEARRVAACIAVVFTELAEPQTGSGFCWAKNVQSPSALRRHWWKIYAAARDQKARSQLGRLAPVIRAGSGDVTPLGDVLAEHRERMEGRRQLGAGRPGPLGDLPAAGVGS